MANTVRYVVQWGEQPMYLSKVLSSLVESQTLVDLTVNCNSYTIKVHKCVLAASSSYFRDHLQKDMSIDRVVINGVRHIVLKSLIEFMYCGETAIPEENIEELVAAAKFFCVKGITCILPQKLGFPTPERSTECNLINKPPLFFSKNDKKYSFKEKDSNYSLFDTTGRRKHSHTKVTDEAHVALAKEEAASRFALEMLKKDINNTSNVFVIDETCTEATVETNLTTQYENSNMMQIQEYVIQNDIKNDPSDPNDINNLLPKTKQSPNDENEISGGYVNVSNQILESLTYHVMPEDGNVDFQHYICNNFGQYSVQLDPTQQEGSYEIVNNLPTETKKPMTFTQLVADTISSDYDTENTTFENNSENTYENILPENTYKLPKNEETLPSGNVFSPNYTDFGKNIVTPKKKRGRPPKRKLIERTIIETMENENNFPEHVKLDADISTQQNIDNVDLTEIDKENVVPNENTDLEKISDVDLEPNNNENRRQTRSSLKFHNM